MEEETLFDRMHAALDVEPPAGAYERLRVALNQRPVKQPRWPAFSKRWSNMSFRLAAGLALVALAAAILAAIFAIHTASSNQVPAGTGGMSIQAYQKMVDEDNAKAFAAFSAPCDTTTHTGCLGDATRGIPAVEQWLGDLTHASTPARFRVVDAEMRKHLTQNLTALHDLQTAAQAGDGAAMDRAYNVAVYAAAWTSTVIPGITSSHQVDAANYVQLVRGQKQAIDSCAACNLLFTKAASSCATSGGLTCIQVQDEIAIQFAGFEMSLVQKAAPSSLAAKDSRLQNDLAQADSLLLTMRLAAAANDQAGFDAGGPELQRIIAQIDRDADAILQS